MSEAEKRSREEDVEGDVEQSIDKKSKVASVEQVVSVVGATPDVAASLSPETSDEVAKLIAFYFSDR
jgi:hypothetical protein